MRPRPRLQLLISGLAVGLALCVGIVSTAFAQNAEPEPVERITMSPSSKTLTIDAGSSITDSLEVVNSGDAAFDFIVYARPYGVKDENYTPEFTGKFPNSDANKWVEISSERFSLQPGQKKEVTYKLNVPATASPGGHYGVIFAETRAKPLGSTGIARQKRVGQILFLTVNGTFQRSGKVAGFSLPFWQGAPPLVSTVRVTNSGNVNFDTKVNTTAKDIFGRTKFTYTGDSIVLRETTRLIEMNWAEAPNFGLFNVTQRVKFLGQEHVHSGMVLIAPRWFPLLVVLLIVSGVVYALKQRRANRR